MYSRDYPDLIHQEHVRMMPSKLTCHAWQITTIPGYAMPIELVGVLQLAQVAKTCYGCVQCAKYLVPQVYGFSPEAIGYRHLLFYGPILLKLQLLEAVIVHIIAVIAFLSLVLLDLDKDTLKTAKAVLNCMRCSDKGQCREGLLAPTWTSFEYLYAKSASRLACLSALSAFLCLSETARLTKLTSRLIPLNINASTAVR